MRDELFFDTNILFYAYDATEPSKRRVCEKLVKQALKGEINGVVSNQVLVELFNACTRKLGVPVDQANIIVKSLIVSKHWRKIDYSSITVNRALGNSELFKTPFLDVLMSETMKENGITQIITENEKHLSRIPGIKIINPF